MIAAKERQLNIKDLTTTEALSVQKVLFDPKEYLTVDTPESARQTLSNSMILKSQLTNRFNIKVSASDVCTEVLKQQNIKRSVVEELEKMKNGRKWRMYLRHLAIALLAYPEARDELVTAETKSEKLLDWTNDGLTDNLRNQYFSGLFDLSIIDPTLGKRVVVDEKGKSISKRRVHSKSPLSKTFDVVAAAEARMVFPANPEIWSPSDQDWFIVRNYFEEMRGKKLAWLGYDEIHKYFKYLAAATILGAVDVQLSKEKGLVVTSSRKPIIDDPKPVPVVRRF